MHRLLEQVSNSTFEAMSCWLMFKSTSTVRAYRQRIRGEAFEGMTDECCWKRNPRKRKRCMFESGGTENEAAQDRLSAIPANQAVQRQDEPEM